MSEAMRESERIAGAVLARLYQNGLRPIDIDCHALAAELAEDGEAPETQFKRASQEAPAVIDYLRAEGLIRIGSESRFMDQPQHSSETSNSPRQAHGHERGPATEQGVCAKERRRT